MLREVHGRPKLYIPQAKDTESPRGHHRRHLLPARLRVRSRMLRPRTAIVAFGELAALREEVTKKAPDAKKSTRSFELAEGSKEVLVDPRSTEGKTVRIGTTLSSE